MTERHAPLRLDEADAHLAFMEPGAVGRGHMLTMLRVIAHDPERIGTVEACRVLARCLAQFLEEAPPA